MRDQLENRLRELRAEAELGQVKYTELESQAAGLRNTLLRLSGAIQVLEEELGKAALAVGTGPAAPASAGD